MWVFGWFYPPSFDTLGSVNLNVVHLEDGLHFFVDLIF